MTVLTVYFERYPHEAALIGKLTVGFGEIEYRVMGCLASALNDLETAARVVYRARGEEQRILIADAFMRPKFLNTPLAADYCKTIGAANWCRRIRNQYAHAHWVEPEKGKGLCFVNMEEGAKSNVVPMTHHTRKVTVPILEKQDEYFYFTVHALVHLAREYAALAGRPHSQPLSMPKEPVRPPLYSEQDESSDHQ